MGLSPEPPSRRIQYPSLAKQARRLGGECVVLDRTHLHPGAYHYNPGLWRFEGRLLFCYRRQQVAGESDLGICVLDDRTLQPVPGSSVLLDIPKRFKTFEHLEDPRIFEHAGHLYVSACSWLGPGKGKNWQYMPSQFCAPLRPASPGGIPSVGERILTPSHGRNGVAPQKNWAWFSDRGQLNFVYETSPHEVVTSSGQSLGQVLWPIAWPYSAPRGGTPPVRIGGEFWTFFHAHIPAEYRLRRYLIGAYAFAAEPPYRPTRYTPAPVFVASDEDPFLPWAPKVVFPCGAVFEDQEWKVSVGVHDWYSAILRFPHEELEDLMTTCNYP